MVPGLENVDDRLRDFNTEPIIFLSVLEYYEAIAACISMFMIPLWSRSGNSS